MQYEVVEVQCVCFFEQFVVVCVEGGELVFARVTCVFW